VGNPLVVAPRHWGGRRKKKGTDRWGRAVRGRERSSGAAGPSGERREVGCVSGGKEGGCGLGCWASWADLGFPIFLVSFLLSLSNQLKSI
jgi:hypothetical protein